MQVVRYPEKSAWNALLKRPVADTRDLEDLVGSVFDEVRQKGDAALLDYTEQFDKVVLKNLRLTSEEIEAAAGRIPDPLKEAIEMAYENIHAFHTAQKTPPVQVATRKGVDCWQEKHPIQKVGLYIPGGTAPLFSTVLMLAIPAQIAGCREIVLCSPPGPDGTLHPAILYAARRCGVTTVCRVGGIQAVAAMTHGTQSVPAVYKIFGPGNQYVTAAKQWSTRLGVSIDMPAGPSELLVVADGSAVPEFVAADLLSQAEHGTDSQVLLLTDQQDIFEKFRQGSSSEKPVGTGLGLPISRRIIEHFGGRIQVESRPGHGATFTFELPAMDNA